MFNFLSIPINTLVPIPILSVFTSLLLSVGFIYLSFLLYRKFFKTKPSLCEIFGISLISLGFINTCIYITVQFQLLNLTVIRIFGIILMLVGLIGSVKFIKSYNVNFNKTFLQFKSLSFYLKCVTFLLFLLITAYFLLAISPLTDADSLNYHSGFPVSYLFYGYKLPMNDMLFTRLFGIGESFNFIGIGTWTDHLSSTIQFIGLISLLIILLNYMKSNNESIENKLYAGILLIGVPCLLFLISSQKSEYLGHLAILFALSITILSNRQTQLNLFLSVGALFFAFSIKYSFYVSGFFPFIFLGYISYQNKLFKYFVSFSLLFYLFLLFPLHLSNYIYYGNPVSPSFSQLFSEKGASDLILFENYLKNAGGSGFKFPINLLLPDSIGQISAVLGLGCFSFLFLDYKKRKSVELILLAILTFLITMPFVPRTSRFFLDSYYIFVLAFIVNPIKRRGFTAYNKLLILQTGIVTISAFLGVYMLTQGIMTKSSREKTLNECAVNYNLMVYLDKVLPNKSIIISDFRINVYYPRNFIARDYPFMIKHYPEEFMMRINKQKDFDCFYITYQQLTNTNLLYDAISTTEPYFKPEKFTYATRNPLNKMGIFYHVYIYPVDIRKIVEIAKRSNHYHNWWEI